MSCSTWSGLSGVALLALLGGALAPPALADFPTLARELTLESFPRDSAALHALARTRGVAAAVSLGPLARSGTPGGSAPRVADAGLGGGGEARLLLGRWTLGADFLEDGPREADPGEYRTRIHAAGAWPAAWLAARAVGGLDEGGRAGADLELEPARLPVVVPGIALDLRPAFAGWLRLRKLEGSARPSLHPAAGVVLEHLPALASALALSVTAQAEIERGALPRSFGLVQARWLSLARPLGAGRGDPYLPRARGAPRTTRVRWRWFLYGAWAFALDSREEGRLAAGAGLRFTAPLGGRDGRP